MRKKKKKKKAPRGRWVLRAEIASLAILLNTKVNMGNGHQLHRLLNVLWLYIYSFLFVSLFSFASSLKRINWSEWAAKINSLITKGLEQVRS